MNIEIVCSTCGKPLKIMFSPFSDDPNEHKVRVEPCQHCIKEAENAAHAMWTSD